MLQLKNVVKTYITGDLKQDALKGINISFRENEFVSILGQSGSGKTTMLNIIGGLDRYTSGDLIINGISTKEYKDGDWDYYRNNSIGFVFQSYNLISHQTVLSNVEMALTLAGVSKKERRQRAITVLKKVGLEDHIHKKPNQMSGGQMQRVAIARALINNPDILLADEPTGALDSETSIQIMNLLKEIAKDKLVIMVTHNPELAEMYSTRIVKLLDGKIISDSNPYQNDEKPVDKSKHKKISMSFTTALSLSFNNLKTKKGRTLLTAFAGSIGIIGIALILALSTGMSTYISDIQKETMAAYPITISQETIDVSGIMGVRNEIVNEVKNQTHDKNRTEVYADYSAIKNTEKISSSFVENNLTEFKQYLDDPTSEIHQYLSNNGIVYSYDVQYSVYVFDEDGNFLDTSRTQGNSSVFAPGTSQMGMMNRMQSSPLSSSGTSNSYFQELAKGANDETVSQIVLDNYDVIYGNWPKHANEVILVLNQNNEISANALYQLGFITSNQYDEIVKTLEKDEDPTQLIFEYKDLLNQKFYLVAACDHYLENENGTFSPIEDIIINQEDLLKKAIELNIVGIIRPKEDASNATISAPVAYTSMLTDQIIDHTNNSTIILAQEADEEINVLTGMRFESSDDASKAEDAKNYLSSLTISEKASFYKLMMVYSSNTSATNVAIDETSMARMLDMWLNHDPSEEILLKIYDEYIAGSSYQDNMNAFGKVSYDAPSSISLYTDSFNNKDGIAECIQNYNMDKEDDKQITYTDYVALLTSSITMIIDGISYVLIAFVSISLVVSCIMIGIITHISVMERTKEIGILRSLGASKQNISQVFNAETFIIGCCAGILGIGVSLLALIPINAIIEKLSGLTGLKAQLSVPACLILIAISIIITIIGGLYPAKKAAKKDPVIALRTE